MMLKIPKEELNSYKTNVIYDKGYRIIFYYDNHHEAAIGLYSEDIESFMKFFKENNISPKFDSVDDILNRFLIQNQNALGVSIYSIDQKCIAKKIRDDILTVNDSEVYKEELIYDYNDVIVKDGYRLVYFYPNNIYEVGIYSATIEGFMIDFVEFEPIMDEDDIPPFISIDDILERSLKMFLNFDRVGIYKIDGTLIAEKDRTKNNIK